MSAEIKSAEINLWGTRIGVVHKTSDDDTYNFQYDNEFSHSGIEVSPFVMPLSNNVYSFPLLNNTSFNGLPGLLADSLPDKFGNAVINTWLAKNGRLPSSLNAIERLCYIGKRGFGALEYVPTIEIDDKKTIDEDVDIYGLTVLASKILSDKEKIKIDIDELQLSKLLKLGTSAGGARAKAIIAINGKNGEIKSGEMDAGEDFSYWIMKFDGIVGNGDHGIKDSSDYTKIEYAYYLMARDCNIDMNECRLLDNNGLKHFITKRFDRYTEKGKMQKVHMQTLGALTHLDYNIPNLCSYEMLFSYAKRLNNDENDMIELFRRMVFNVLSVNCDDHVKNFSFLMNKSGNWRLSPAYDITFAYKEGNKWISKHQMTINGKSKNITSDDMIAVGRSIGLKISKCKRIIEEEKEIISHWIEYANSTNVSEEKANIIYKVIMNVLNEV